MTQITATFDAIAHPATVMEIEGKNALVLGAGGMVGAAVCRLLLSHRPGRLVVASRRKSRAQDTAEQLAGSAGPSTRVVPVWGDVFMRADWQRDDPIARSEVLADPVKRYRLTRDILDPLDEDIAGSSLLTQIIAGSAPGPDGSPAHIVVDCMNTATAVGYQNLYALAQRLIEPAARTGAADGGRDDIETLLASLYVPQLVRHVQLLYEGMRRAGTEAYIKVGTSGTGGMGFNIPYTHSEERPSRLLLSKAALAGAQTLLTFLMARTPEGPRIVREIKPTALIGWRVIGFGPVVVGGREISLYDCPPEQAVPLRDEGNLASAGHFGQDTGKRLEAVYIDTGENGQFSAAEFGSITSVGQMGLVTPEEIAENVLREIFGDDTGRDIIAAFEGSVMGPSYRADHLRQAALNRLRQLEDKYGEAVAFEILGPPRSAADHA